jgi:2'-5' RNA ligase
VPRLFFAVWPPNDVVARLVALPRPDERGVRWMPAENLHVTLRFLGEADAELAAAALDGVALPPATARVGPAARRLGGRNLVVPVTGLDELATVVTATTCHLGRPPDGRPFRGHITLARLKRGADQVSVSVPVDDHFDADAVVLVRSDLSSRGATYHRLRQWPTTGNSD